MGRTRSMYGGLLAVVIGTSLVVAACGGSSSAAPTLAPGQTATPEPRATPGATATPGSSVGTPDGGLAFGGATTALDALDSYEYSVEIATSKMTAGVETKSRNVMSGVVVNRPDKASRLVMDEYGSDDTLKSSTGVLIIGELSWVRNNATDPWEAIPLAQASQFAQIFASFRPEQIFGLYFAGLGNDFTNAGTESKNGVPSTHFKGGEGIATILGAIAGFQGNWTSDVWLATDGGYLVHSEASGEGVNGADTGTFRMIVDISKPNAAGPIETPS